MKPRLFRGGGWWWCLGDGLAGRGVGPRSAYADWVNKRVFYSEMGIVT